jgi:hypothetical protein
MLDMQLKSRTIILAKRCTRHDLEEYLLHTWIILLYMEWRNVPRLLCRQSCAPLSMVDVNHEGLALGNGHPSDYDLLATWESNCMIFWAILHGLVCMGLRKDQQGMAGHDLRHLSVYSSGGKA